MNDEKKKVPVLSIALYVVSGLLAIFMFWSLYNSYVYISDLISQGQLEVKGNLFAIMNFYMTDSSNYAVYSIILGVLGWMLQKNEKNRNFDKIELEDVKEESVEDDSEDKYFE